MNVKGWMISLLVPPVAVALSLLIAAGGEQRTALGQQDEPTPAPTPAQAADAMAVDAISGGAIDPTRTVTGTAPFQIDIVVTDVPTPYHGYQYVLEWDPAVLALESVTSLAPPDLLACGKAERQSSSVWSSCARSGEGIQFLGPVATMAFRCVADGRSALHLGGPAWVSSPTSMVGPGGGTISTVLVDASVTCRDVGPPPPPPVPPANDNFPNAKAVDSLPFSDSVITAGATRETAEPYSGHMGHATVWYSFTPRSSEFIRADTFGSDFDTVLAVYAGASLASLTPVVCNDDVDGLQSRVTVELAGGGTYYFQVGGFYGDRGSLVFNVQAVSPPLPPTPSVIVVDAVSGGGIEANRVVTGTAPFDIDIGVTSVGQPYIGYQYLLRWDPAILAYDGQTDLGPAGLTLCAVPFPLVGRVSGACGRTPGGTEFVGPLNTVALHCVADGTSALHLVTLAEDSNFGNMTLGYGGMPQESVLVDASITCQGTGGRPGSSQASTPVRALPATGTGGFLGGPEPP